ncbi:MAG TPA: methyltransferase domain-containing protein [Verrucomicrobiae bacterium]|nr:methyltransferase domain-containing protein [Verrucomicrobiae bacterium]
MASSALYDVEKRARLSKGASIPAVYRMVVHALSSRGINGGTFVDFGCGSGQLFQEIGKLFVHCVGVDAARYDGLPVGIEFFQADLGSGRTPVPDAIGDVVASVETIEHLENPRALFRELRRVAKPGAWIIVTTPNQLSFLSLATLLFKQQFNHFQDSSYPAHLTALLEIDLRRIAAECGLEDVDVEYSRQGRIILTPWHYPRVLSRLFPRGCSDNVLLIGRRPRSQ